jgi:hypothetical protein
MQEYYSEIGMQWDKLMVWAAIFQDEQTVDASLEDETTFEKKIGEGAREKFGAGPKDKLLFHWVVKEGVSQLRE